MTVTGTNIVVDAADSATVRAPEDGAAKDTVCVVEFSIDASSAPMDGFVVLRRAFPGNYAFGMSFALSITAGG
jgi:hypothetical protein